MATTTPPEGTTQASLASGNGRISKGAWMALAAALLGWMFDGAEMGIFSLVGRSAMKDLLGEPEEGIIAFYFAVILAFFLVGAATGGVLFGWLGDRIGRVRAMTLSVLTYAVFTGLCGLVSMPLNLGLFELPSVWQLGLLRFIASLGMGGEWSLGVALVMEIWPNKSRAFMAGLIGAAANVGYLLVGLVGLGLKSVLAEIALGLGSMGFSETTVASLTAYQGWRVMMILGTLPALLTFFIRLFVPESERWKHEQASGKTSHWATRDLLGVVVGAMGPCLIIYLWSNPWSNSVRLLGSVVGLCVATAGYSYPVMRYLSRQASSAEGDGQRWQPTFRRMLLAAGLAGVALLGTWGAAQWAPNWADKLTHSDLAQGAKYYTQMASAIGAILGTILAALAGDWFGRRIAYTLLCITSLASILLLYQGPAEYGTLFLGRTFLTGVCTASFYGWLPLYLPELFRTNVRATGQGFGFNFGRIIAAIGTLQGSKLFEHEITLFGHTFEAGYPTVCSGMGLVYLVGIVLIWFAPETRGKPLPD